MIQLLVETEDGACTYFLWNMTLLLAQYYREISISEEISCCAPIMDLSSVTPRVPPGCIAEERFEIWVLLNTATVKSVEPENNSFCTNHIIRWRSKLLPLGFSKFVLVLIL